MNYKSLILSLAAVTFLAAAPAQANADWFGKKKDKTEKTDKKDTTAKKPEPPKKGPVAFDKFIKKDAKTMTGMTTVIRQEDKYFLEIPDSLLGKEILMVSRISKGSANTPHTFDGYAGDELNEMVVKFDKGPDDKIFLLEISYKERSEEGQPMYESLINSNTQSIISAFDVKAWGKDKKSCIIDVTDLFNSDNGELFFDKNSKKSFGLGTMDKTRSYISSIKTYPINTEVKTVKTFSKAEGEGAATFELNCSFVMLPENPMTPRYMDDRVGYFGNSYTDYDKNPQGIEKIRQISRWRLEPKPEDVAKYKRGELVEPAKPIVFYIDPTTPAKWIPYLIAGVNDWQKAFEKAGFKNAIRADVAPTYEQDSTFSLEDARHSAIVYKPSEVENAMGPHVSDPRTGEILESHVSWYHNVMQLLRDWYFIQCAPVDTAARHMKFDDELMGNLIRFVSSHEVGHTLGLRHNFIGSNFTTVANLRDTNFLKKYGHSTSIMDYARFDYVAQPGDKIPQKYLFPRISDYDLWAIQWGYRRYLVPGDNDPKAEVPIINKWIRDSLAANPRLTFGTESSPNDPRLQSEDLGANQMETNAMGVKNLQFIMKNLEEWTYTPDKNYEDLQELYDQVVGQYKRYIGHVSKWVGGVYETPQRVEDGKPVRVFVDKAKQKEAMEWLDKYLFEVPTWIVPDKIVYKTVRKPEYVLDGCFKQAFNALLSKRLLMNINEDMLQNGANAYSMTEFFNDLNKNVMGAMPTDPAMAIYKRVEQKAYVNALCALMKGDTAGMAMMRAMGGSATNDDGDVMSAVYYQLKTLKTRLQASAATDMLTKAHNDYLVSMIDGTLDGVFKKASK
jgi:hypothetical protein